MDDKSESKHSSRAWRIQRAGLEGDLFEQLEYCGDGSGGQQIVTFILSRGPRSGLRPAPRKGSSRHEYFLSRYRVQFFPPGAFGPNGDSSRSIPEKNLPDGHNKGAHKLALGNAQKTQIIAGRQGGTQRDRSYSK